MEHSIRDGKGRDRIGWDSGTGWEKKSNDQDATSENLEYPTLHLIFWGV